MKSLPIKINEEELLSHRKAVHLLEGSPTKLSDEAEEEISGLSQPFYRDIRNRNDCTNCSKPAKDLENCLAKMGIAGSSSTSPSGHSLLPRSAAGNKVLQQGTKTGTSQASLALH